MTYLSDRARIELALPAVLLRRTFAPVLEKEQGVHIETMDLIKQAAAEPFADLDASRKAALVRRVEQLQTDLMMPYESSAAGKCLLMVAAIVQHLTNDSILLLNAGSPMDIALERIIEGLGGHPDLWQAMSGSAERHSRKILAQLRKLGYYQPIAREAA